MLLSLVYIAVQLVLQLLALLFRSPDSRELEIVVLRHELAILRRQVHRPVFRPADRWFLAAASRAVDGDATDHAETSRRFGRTRARVRASIVSELNKRTVHAIDNLMKRVI